MLNIMNITYLNRMRQLFTKISTKIYFVLIYSIISLYLHDIITCVIMHDSCYYTDIKTLI